MATVNKYAIKAKGRFRPGELVTTGQYAIIVWSYKDESMLYDYSGVLKIGEIAVVVETIRFIETKGKHLEHTRLRYHSCIQVSASITAS